MQILEPKQNKKGRRKMNKVVITNQERDNEHAITGGNDKEGNVS